MEPIYIYCLVYENCNPQGMNYLYVGSHKGNPQIDGYRGSSKGPWHSWRIKEVVVLCDDAEKENKDHPLHVESRYIESYARMFGVAQCVQCHCNSNNPWVRKYVRYNGRLLNAHASNIENAAYASRLPEARAKAVAHTDYRAIAAKRSPESYKKAVAHTDYRAIAAKRDWKAFNKLGNSPEARAKAVAHTDYRAIAAKLVEKVDYIERTKKIDYKISRRKGAETFKERLQRYKLADGFIGNSHEIVSHISYKGKYVGDVTRWLQGKRKPAKEYITYFPAIVVDT